MRRGRTSDLDQAPRARERTSVVGSAFLAFVIAAVITVSLWYVISQSWVWHAWLFAWLVGVNVTALGYYGWDKSRARRARARVPEVVLYGLALLGGSIGAYAGMHLFRHKTVKGRFLLVFWTIVLLQAGLVATAVRYFFFTP